LLWNDNTSLCQIIDIFCVSQPALVGCDDDAQISGDHIKKKESKSVAVLSQTGGIMDGKKDNGWWLFLSLLCNPTSSHYPSSFVWFNLTDKAC